MYMHEPYACIMFVCIQVSFQSGFKVILSRQNFEWNKSSFSEQFKSTTTAGEFITIWNRVTIMDQQRQLAIPIGETQDVSLTSAGSSQSSTSSCAGTTHSLSDVDNSLQPASKRATYSNHTSTCASGQQHANPIDDAIHSKRIGKVPL